MEISVVLQDAAMEPVKRSADVLHGLHVALTALHEAAADAPPPAGRAAKDEDQYPHQDQDALFIGCPPVRNGCRRRAALRSPAR